MLYGIFLREERMCKVELCCLAHRRNVSALCLLYEIYHRAYRPLHEYLPHFVATRNTRASAALCELVSFGDPALQN